eukprot:6213133-Pleurochrysis_carterae.AAC.2
MNVHMANTYARTYLPMLVHRRERRRRRHSTIPSALLPTLARVQTARTGPAPLPMPMHAPPSAASPPTRSSSTRRARCRCCTRASSFLPPLPATFSSAFLLPHPLPSDTALLRFFFSPPFLS